jgi:hypothetical protein
VYSLDTHRHTSLQPLGDRKHYRREGYEPRLDVVPARSSQEDETEGRC